MPDNSTAIPTHNPTYTFPDAAGAGDTVAIVCPGPSLEEVETIDFAAFDYVFAVNYAALRVPKKFLTAFMCLDGYLDHIWQDRWPHHLPRIHITHGPAKRLKKAGCLHTFPLLLAEVLYRFPENNIDLYGVDYRGKAYHTRCPWTPRRETTELAEVAQAWHPHRDRIRNHGTFDLAQLEQFLS